MDVRGKNTNCIRQESVRELLRPYLIQQPRTLVDSKEVTSQAKNMLNLQVERHDHKIVRLGFLLPEWAWSAVPRPDGLSHETPNLVERPGPPFTTAGIGYRQFFPKDWHSAVLNLPQHLNKDSA